MPVTPNQPGTELAWISAAPLITDQAPVSA